MLMSAIGQSGSEPFPARAAHDPVRVGLLIPNLDGGGAERVVLRIADGLVARGIAVDLVAGRFEGPYRSNVPGGVNVIDLRTRFPQALWKTAGLTSYLRQARPSALIASLDVVAGSVIARQLAGSPTVLVQWIHTNLSQQLPNTSNPVSLAVRRLAIRTLYAKADAIVAVSEGVADDVAALAGLPRSRVSVVHNPLITPRVYEMAAQPLTHPWFQAADPPTIVAVGRLVKQKDYPTLLRAMARLRERVPARLVILGDSDPREPHVRGELQALIGHLGLHGHVELLGFVENPFAYMARASALALSSIYEGLPSVIVEALAVGTPVVATDCPSGPREILEGGRFGELVAMGDHGALADALARTLANPPNREPLKQRGARFSIEAGTEGHLAVVRDAICNARAAGRDVR